MIEKIKHLVNYNSRLLDFSDKDMERLRQSKDVLLSCADEVVDLFYHSLFEVAETRKIFKEGERTVREQTMRDWYIKTISTEIDDRYWLWQWLVGALHVKRGVENPMMVSMMAVVQKVVMKKAIATLGVDEGAALYLSFCKLTNLVVCLVIKSYEESTYEAIQNATGMSRELIHTNIVVGLEEQIKKVGEELGR